MPPYTAMCLDGTHVVAYYFNNAEENARWHNAVMDIKNTIADIVQNTMAGQGRSLRCQAWINQCCRFIQTWGKACTPPDIKIAINDIEGCLGLPKMNWD